jgi:hypothetical protein
VSGSLNGFLLFVIVIAGHVVARRLGGRRGVI